MQYVFRKGAPFSVERNIRVPKGETSLKSLGNFCGSIATRSLRHSWNRVQSTTPELEDIQPKLIEPNKITMVHSAEVNAILTSMAYAEETNGIKRSQARRVADPVHGLVDKFLYDAAHTIKPDAIRGVKGINYPSGLRFYISLSHEVCPPDMRGYCEIREHNDAAASLGAERRSLERAITSHTDDTLSNQYSYGMYFAEIPHTVADLWIRPDGLGGPSLTLPELLITDVNRSLVEHRRGHIESSYRDQGIFMVDPPYISHGM